MQLSASAINIIKIIAGTGIISYNGDNILATKAYLRYNRMVAVDTSGDIYIADSENHRIRKVTKMTGIITTIAGTGVPGYNGENIAATSALLNLPAGIAIDSTGDIYITDQINQRLRILSKKTGNITTVAGNGFATFHGDNIQSSLSILNRPAGIAIDASRNIYFTDILNHRVRMINIITGIITTVAGDGNNRFTGDDILATTTALNRPNGLCLDTAGNLFIADTNNHRIRMVNKKTGIITTVAGTGIQGYNGDLQQATSAHLNSPLVVLVDASGNLYISDTVNNRIRMVPKSTGIITTIVGNGYAAPAEEGKEATLSSILGCGGLALDSVGDLIVSDQGCSKVFKVKLLDQTAVQTSIPSAVPTPMPSAVPTSMPSAVSTSKPSAVPTSIPGVEPTSMPSAVSTSKPSAVSRSKPSAVPTSMPSAVTSQTHVAGDGIDELINDNALASSTGVIYASGTCFDI